MLILLCAALVACGVAVSARWHATRVDALGRARPYPLLAAVCLELAALAAVPVVRITAEQHRLGRVATELAGAPATVHCQRLASAMADLTNDLGHVNLGQDGRPERSTLIKNEQCRLLGSYLASATVRRRPSYREVVAVHVLTHESMHMRGITGEALAECAAVQRDQLTAEMLGATRDEAHLLALRYWLTVYPLMPDDYRSADCGPGLPLDEHLPSAPWLRR
ncbi:MAG: hypothetical protein ACJ74O_15785 [Frankiaceae bacterium]